MIIKQGGTNKRGGGRKQQKVSKILDKVDDLAYEGKYKKAISEIEKAIGINPEDGNLYNRLGDLCVKTKDMEKALDAYKKGIEMFENDYYPRNALALCKKVLRYDPDNLEILPAMGNLLIELGDKSDALNYYFDYINKLKADNNKQEVLKTLKYIQTLHIKDNEVLNQIAEFYKEIGKENLASGILKRIEITQKKEKKDKETGPKRTPKDDIVVEGLEASLEKATKKSKKAKEAKVKVKTQTQDTSKQMEKAVAELRKAIRLDELVKVMEKSIDNLSRQQKDSIALFQKSLTINLDSLETSIKKLKKDSAKNMDELEKLLKGLAKAISSLNKNQSSFGDRIGNYLDKLGKNFKGATKAAVNDIKALSSSYERATEDMCEKLEETKGCNVSMVKTSEELKDTVQKINQTLLEVIATQEHTEKKYGLYFIILLVLIGLMCGMLAVSLFI